MATKKVIRKKLSGRTTPIPTPVIAVGEAPDHSPGVPFPVVAIGASAGGLAAFTALLKALPVKSGMAFVLIQHLEPKHESALTSLLSKATRMPVTEVTNGIAVEPDHVYVIPPNKCMAIRKGELLLTPRSQLRGPQLPIDHFSIALAEEQGNRAIGVVLSGTGTDGTCGLKAIKAAGGVTFAQDPKTTEWPPMPMSAIAAGSVDFVLSPRRIAAELARIGRHPYRIEAGDEPESGDLDEICMILRAAVNVDFRLYKGATVRRRILRRMALHKISGLPKYLHFLKQNPGEVKDLVDDIFIHVTGFFRDPVCFEALRKRVLAKLRARKSSGRSDDEPIRIWIAGCSTGEEVYSIAMLLLEELGADGNRAKIQIFGTDIQERALEFARTGIYSDAAAAGISKARLRRFFVRTDHGLQIVKSVRELCVFARHNLTRDPPFSRLDLISCRNVLIYMGPALQKRILSTFQYALKPGGFLFLGTSESVSDYSAAFAPSDAKGHIFARKTPLELVREAPFPSSGHHRPDAVPARPLPPAAVDFRKEAETALLANYAPPALVVDRDLHIIHFQGDTSPFLAPATGQPSFHLLKMVRPEFVMELRTAIARARKENAAVHRDGLPFDYEGKPNAVRLEVRPLAKRNGSRKQDLLVVFQKAELRAPEPEESGAGGRGGKQAAAKAARLERELGIAREHLRALIAEHETVQEQMKAANEEMLSGNEEMQSTNEELETAREELQSTNEELITLNDELQHRNSELKVVAHDLGNLLSGIDIPVLVLDADLLVRRFTPAAGALLNLIAGDVGRPFSDIASTLDVGDWREILAGATNQGRLVDREVTDRGGHRYSMQVRPYMTDDRKVEGVLIVLLDTDVIYRARDAAQRSSDYAQAIVDTIHEALIVLDPGFRILSVNGRYCELFQVTSQEMRGQLLVGREPGRLDAPALSERLREVLSKGEELKDFEIDQNFPRIGRRRLVINGTAIEGNGTILIAIEDATIRKLAREESDRTESTIRALLDSSSQSVIAVDESGKIGIVNNRAEKMFGRSRNELLQQPVTLLISEPTLAAFTDRHRIHLAEVLNRQGGIDLNLEGVRRDGTRFPADVNLSVMHTGAGKFIVAFVSDITQRLEQEKEAQTRASEAQVQVQALAARLLSTQEEERRRVSRELHDQICQQLASLAIDISAFAAAPSPPAKERERLLKDLQARVVEASEATRHIAYQLHPSVLDDLGLVASLRELCKQVSDRGGVKVQFQHNTLPSEVSREIASCLYRVAQESLQNIVSHSGSKKASVTLDMREGSIILSVVDDGTGFDIKAAGGRGGLGLVGMKERARLVRGKLDIVARPGRGTKIELQVPFRET